VPCLFLLVIHTALLILLEATIGIEPMNKGFAVLKSLFSCVWVNTELCPFIWSFDIRPLLCSPEFEVVSPGSDPRVTQEC